MMLEEGKGVDEEEEEEEEEVTFTTHQSSRCASVWSLLLVMMMMLPKRVPFKATILSFSSSFGSVTFVWVDGSGWVGSRWDGMGWDGSGCPTKYHDHEHQHKCSHHRNHRHHRHHRLLWVHHHVSRNSAQLHSNFSCSFDYTLSIFNPSPASTHFVCFMTSSQCLASQPPVWGNR